MKELEVIKEVTRERRRKVTRGETGTKRRALSCRAPGGDYGTPCVTKPRPRAASATALHWLERIQHTIQVVRWWVQRTRLF